MRKRAFINSMVLMVMLTSCASQEKTADTTDRDFAVIGYVPGFRGVIDETLIDATMLTHINYAFVNVKDSMAWLENIATDTVNFRKLNRLKSTNPALKILISVGGWAWSDYFSDAVLTPNSRRKFARTNIDIVAKYDLDGVDIDWEYPGMIGEDNVFRPEDRENFTRMFRALREALDTLSATTGKRYLLTTATPCFSDFHQVADMGDAQQYLDFINLMAYDFYVAGDTAGHHANLYPSENYEREQSAHRAYREYTAAGVPAEKLVLGLPFYGRSWFMKSADNYGINRRTESVTRGRGYTFIKDSLVTSPGFVRHWDENAKVPYLFNEETNQLVSYDDEESVRKKCAYVKEHNMAGVMFWEYFSDPKEYLLNAIHETREQYR